METCLTKKASVLGDKDAFQFLVNLIFLQAWGHNYFIKFDFQTWIFATFLAIPFWDPQ